ncbi:MAG: hypothetical protein ACYDDB_04175 [bacterium]
MQKTNSHTDKSKVDSFLIHAMPFVPSYNRKDNFEIIRNWGDKTIKIKTTETLNSYDLISLLQLLRDYIQNRKNYGAFQWGSDGDEKLLAFGFTIDLSDFAAQRGIENDINNRKMIFKSIERLWKMEIEIWKEKEPSRSTRFIYDLKPNSDFTKAIGFVNKLFYDFCLKSGLAINLDRLISYRKNGYAIILDTFLQSTEKRYKQYPEELLFQKLSMDNTGLTIKDKREILKKVFATVNKNYRYDKKFRCWKNSDSE